MDFKEESSLPSMHTPPPSVKFLLLAFSVVQIQLQDFQLSGTSGQETTGHANKAISNIGTPQTCTYGTPPRLINPAKKLDKQSTQSSIALQQHHYHYLGKFLQSLLEKFPFNLYCKIQAYPYKRHPSTCLMLFYRFTNSENHFLRIKLSQVLSSVESKKVSGQYCNTERAYSQL